MCKANSTGERAVAANASAAATFVAADSTRTKAGPPKAPDLLTNLMSHVKSQAKGKIQQRAEGYQWPTGMSDSEQKTVLNIFQMADVNRNDVVNVDEFLWLVENFATALPSDANAGCLTYESFCSFSDQNGMMTCQSFIGWLS